LKKIGVKSIIKIFPTASKLKQRIFTISVCEW